jgi:UDP-glucose 4-epimerase
MAARKAREDRKRRVMITGVTSTVGRHLAQHLYDDPRVGCILGVALDPRPYYFKDLDPARFRYLECNILKYRQLTNLFHSKAFRDAAPDTVVHLAFMSRPEGADEDMHELNIDGTRRLLDRCLETPSITKFIFKSSCIVYKVRHDNPVYLDENADLNFDTDADRWVKDRVDADMICSAHMDNPRVKIVVLRFSSIMGAHVRGHLNSYFDSPVVFKVAGFDPMLNLIHMKDVIQALRLSVFKDVKGIFNIGGLTTAPISTIAELNRARCVSLAEPLLGPVNRLMRGMGWTRFYYAVDRDRMKYTALLDDSRARKILGYHPQGHVEFGGE